MRQDCIDTFDTKSAPLPSWGQWAKAGARMVRADVLLLVTTLTLWRTRWHRRRGLHQLSDATLLDVGLSRTQIEQEADKPFWRA